jgi:UDP-GlcNAc3NAcA epimerase
MADLLLAPSDLALANLTAENICPSKIVKVGDVMYDAFLYATCEAERKSTVVKDLGLPVKGYILATVHRPENTDDAKRFRTLFAALTLVARQIPVVLPLHPRTRATLQRYGMLEHVEQSLQVIDPVGYLDILMLEKNSALIATDSGGVQREAYFWRIPCVTLLDETEWFELVEYGWNRACPLGQAEEVAACILAAICSKGQEVQLYGDGQAARRVARLLGNGVRPQEVSRELHYSGDALEQNATEAHGEPA